jgi:hypothetical protein
MLVEKEPRRGEIIMTPGVTGGCEEVLVLRAPKAAKQTKNCIAAYGALHFIRSGKPRALTGVIIMTLLRSYYLPIKV